MNANRASRTEPFEIIDRRAVQAPEPFEPTLEALDRLPHGRELLLLASYQPRPLLRMLRLNGFDYRSRFVAGGWFEIRVWHSANTADASDALE